MLRRIIVFVYLMCFFYSKSNGQACSTLGQTPATAFPVCGATTFHQEVVPQCVNNNVPASVCGSYADTNPFWYQFTCYTAGTLQFTITPNDLGDDYDWEVFDITGHNASEVYTNPSLFLVANWSGSYGVTGTSNTTNAISCGSNPLDNVTTFSTMPTLVAGHIYLLLVSHFTQTQSGYSLSFDGGTAVITDPLKPTMQNASTDCSGQNIFLKLNKAIKCNSLASNGSDFSISPSLANVKSASGINCSAGFDMDSLSITFDKPLPPGNYQLIIKNGSDDNTLLDDCDNAIPEYDSIAVTVLPLAPTPMDSIMPVQCSSDSLILVFKNPIRCNTIASNGSDFNITGSTPVTITNAAAENCINGLSNIIKVKISKPIISAGNYTITLQQGNDGNSLIDQCAQETPAGSSLNFSTADVVSASFNYKVDLGCVLDTLFYSHDGANNVNTWNWIFDVNGTSSIADSFFTFKDYGAKHIKLFVSNGVCSDSSSADILLDNELVSRINVTPSLQMCPEDAATFSDSSIGKIVSWYWVFGDGTTSTLQFPPKKYYPQPSSSRGSTFPAALIVKNDIGCFDTSGATITVFYNCYIAVPSAFTPNGDGLNDYLYPLNAYKADNLEFRIYNRWGQLVFETKDWTRKWDGKINGNPQAAGTYVWTLQYTHHDTGQHYSLKGTTVLIR